MPVYTPYPGPGKGISPAGINKMSGWGGVSIGQAGLNKTSGKSLSGLDQATNPIVTSTGVASITATGATVTWTTAPAQPLGTVQHRLAGSTGAYTTVNETGTPPVSSHAVPLTGLTTAKTYEYVVTQPATGGVTAGKTVYSGRFTTA